ncbi:hypothetical protein H5410_051911 [Solanum commersonii]|uniref:Uncharacterized protein n=1 Tax=Solanum commersonii TaxID=4109 RepID=A0A9J5X1V5_SOLCO|nr:hypothetical protein H5410_051911 [Solanum commersonii]
MSSSQSLRKHNLARAFPQILRRIRVLGMEFLFVDPAECNLHMVREFYANWALKARSHYVMVQGRNVPITPISINDILGTPQDADPLVLTGLIIRHPYQGPDTEFGPTLTTVERHRRNELIMARMYVLEMLFHQNGSRASIDLQLDEVERRYPMNDHANALLGIGPNLREPVDNDI